MHAVMKCAVLGDHDAPVPEEEVWGDQDQPLPLRYLSVPLHFHQDLGESSYLGRSSQNINIQSVLLSSVPPSLCVSAGGHVFRSSVYPAGIRVEHLRCRRHPSVNYSLVHCHRCVCLFMSVLNLVHTVTYKDFI